MVFPMVFGLSTIGPDGFFSLATIGLDGFAMDFGLASIGLNGFSMVADHWSNDGMVTIHRYGLIDIVYGVMHAILPFLYLYDVF